MNAVTLGGLTLGLSLLIWLGMRWFLKEGRQIAALAQTIACIAYGMLAIITTGGLIAGIAGIGLWGANGLGDLGLVYGVGGITGDVTRAHSVALTPGGYVVFALLTVTLACFAKWSRTVPISKILFGVLCGITLGLSGTVAGTAAVPLASAVNAIGVITEVIR